LSAKSISKAVTSASKAWWLVVELLLEDLGDLAQEVGLLLDLLARLEAAR
jgi:hypothetical protein